jgi:hypothetical protein
VVSSGNARFAAIISSRSVLAQGGRWFNRTAINKPQPSPSVAPVRQDVRAAKSPLTEQVVSAGTTLTVRMIDRIDSHRDHVGQSFRASMDKPVNDASGRTLIPRGADAVVRLIDDKESGKLTGRTLVTLELVSVSVSGRVVQLDTLADVEASSSRTARSAKLIGGGAAAGALLGALRGGGSGAAIGAASGGAAGTAVELITKGQRVHVPSEERLTFVLRQPARI